MEHPLLTSHDINFNCHQDCVTLILQMNLFREKKCGLKRFNILPELISASYKKQSWESNSGLPMKAVFLPSTL